MLGRKEGGRQKSESTRGCEVEKMGSWETNMLKGQRRKAKGGK